MSYHKYIVCFKVTTVPYNSYFLELNFHQNKYNNIRYNMMIQSIIIWNIEQYIIMVSYLNE